MACHTCGNARVDKCGNCVSCRGATGPTGPRGATGPAGVTGATGSVLGGPLARVSRTTDQSIPNATNTAVIFDHKDADTDDMFDPAAPSWLTIQTDGYYDLVGTAAFPAGAVGYRAVGIAIDGVLGSPVALESGNPIPTGVLGLTAIANAIFLTTNQTVSLTVYQSSGGAQGITATDYAPTLSAVLVG